GPAKILPPGIHVELPEPEYPARPHSGKASPPPRPSPPPKPIEPPVVSVHEPLTSVAPCEDQDDNRQPQSHHELSDGRSPTRGANFATPATRSSRKLRRGKRLSPNSVLWVCRAYRCFNNTPMLLARGKRSRTLLSPIHSR